MAAVHEVSETALAELVPRLRQLVAVGRTEHMTRAAQALGVPQPTLSRSIARLERDLGLTLFVRSGRSLRLTPEGRVLLEHGERALTELEAGLRAVGRGSSSDGGRVAFGFLHTLGSSTVPQLLRSFRVEHPGVRFELVQRGHDALVELVRTGAVDLCLTSPLPDDPDLSVVALREQQLRLVVSDDHPLAGRARLRLAEVAQEQFVGLGRGYGLRTTSDAWCREAGFVPRLAFEGEDIDTVRGLVAAGLGVALLPAGGTSDGVVELDVVEPRTTRTLGLVWRTSGAQSPAVRAFRETVLTAGPRLLAAPGGRAYGQDR